LPTKIGRFADGIMEAAWLAAMILVPVFFNIYSSRIFEPDKISLLRSLALLILAAWIIKLIEESGIRWQNIQRGENWRATLSSIPLLLPVMALAIAFLISTIFSVTPRISLWGSYQRLQGTYTMFSYLVVFFSMIVNLRRKAQLHRIVTVIILSSLPVSLYGLLQRYQLDPIPWGGDTTARIASNMGNSIFVAAYLIMVFPLTLMRIVESFEALLGERGWYLPHFVRATGYIFIVCLQSLAIFFTNSRGPWLGWGASVVFLWLGLSLIWRKRWLTTAGVIVAVAGGFFLVVLNIPNGPLESLRNRPEFGRLGQLLDAESRTGRVRTLIWEGAAQLALPHPPLEYPDGSQDRLNFFRPLIGYGPESMYVAYNPFYPPELTQVEKRNASPDRSHNETWDSLVITGLFGLAAYLWLFAATLFFGLKWLGLIGSARQRNMYLTLLIGGGALSSIFFIAWRGIAYLGVALPFGMISGVVAYLIWISLFGRFTSLGATLDSSEQTGNDRQRSYLVLGLLAAVVAHLVEINFGIAIVATRTYFWVYLALLLLAGFVLSKKEMIGEGNSQVVETLETKIGEGSSVKVVVKGGARKTTSTSGRKKRREEGWGSVKRIAATWSRQAVILGIILSLLLTCMGYLYITNSHRDSNALGMIWSSFTRMKPDQAGVERSSGLAALIFTTWIVGAALLVSEAQGDLTEVREKSNLAIWMKMLVVTLGISIFSAGIYWLLHAGRLISLTRSPANSLETVVAQVAQSEGLLSVFYIFVFALIFGLATFLISGWPARISRLGTAGGASLASGLFVICIIMIVNSNIRIVQADIAFKTGDLFARPDTWPVSIAIYDRARNLAPSEDYYYLFLGRAYLEYAKTLNDQGERERLIQQASRDLLKAQQINPLNTDHTANLARLYNLWAAFTPDASLRDERARSAENFFSRAVVLSPNNARLWGEYALVYMNLLGQPEEGFKILQRALLLDPNYDWTYALIGDYYVRFQANTASSEQEKQFAFQKGMEYYQAALDLAEPGSSLLYNYHLALAGVQVELGMAVQALEHYLQALSLLPNSVDNWRIEEVVARLYLQLGEREKALLYARSAISSAPENYQPVLQELIDQIGG
jgi:tetratricopeptide (TPR) repeat protein